jgi:serine/threonine-protein kinase
VAPAPVTGFDGFHSSQTDNLFDAEDPYVGQVLNDRFVIESKLGEGGFGAVYKGMQKGTNRVVAIKLLHPEMTRDKNVVERFRREGQVLCSLRDAHSVTTYDFDQTKDGTLFIAMELLEGRSLHDVFADEAPIDWRRMVKILSEMCTSLAEAHALGVVHRDLKPENVHLEKRAGNDEFVKILDFGIAKMLRGDGIGGNKGPQLTATGQTLGTLEFMSPEQLMGKELDGRSDIYGMAVLAYELMTGRLPFPDAIGPAMLISAQLKRTPDLPSVAYPAGNIPRDVDSMIFKMLQKHKTDRFADVAEVRSECLRILGAQGLNVSAASLPAVVAHAPAPVQPGGGSPVAQLAAAAASAPGVAQEKEPGPSTRAIIAATAPRSTWIWIVGILVVLAAGGALAYFLTR